MAGSWGNVPRQHLMETIVILWTLNEVPGGHKVNEAAQVPAESSGTRQLTFDREKSVVEILAFLSGTSDDPAKVMAVCVEENLAGDGLTVRLASNSGNCGDIVLGFERIAKILEQSSRREKTRQACQHDLLREIVQLDFWRILSRLRSKHAKVSRKTAGKPSLILQLSAAVNSPLRRKGKKLSADEVAALKEKIQHISKLVMQLETVPEISNSLSEIQDIVMNLSMCFSEISSDETLANLLDNVIDLAPELKFHLKSAVGKIGRYYSASRDLVFAAGTKRYSVFNKILVEEYDLPPAPASYLVGSTSTLETSVQNLICREKILQGRKLSVNLQNCLGKSYQSKSNDFKLRTSNSSKSWKVHAEIKLLFFYELNRADLPPRVICASKSPCYLCHLYFGHHARYHVPNTHGRLYPAWILPTWLDQLSDDKRAHAGSTIKALHTELVHRILKTINQGRVSFNHPNESILWAPTIWSTSSLVSDTTGNNSQEKTASNEAVQELDVASEVPERYGVSMKHQGSPSFSSRNQAAGSPVAASPLACDQPEPKAGLPGMISHSLNPGETANVQLLHTKAQLRISTRRLNLTFTGMPCFEEGTSQTCWIRCSLLDSSDLPGFHSNNELFDVKSITPGSEVSFENGSIDSTQDLLIVARDEVLSIKYSAKQIPSTQDKPLDGQATMV